MQILTSSEMEGRATATKGQRKAAVYIQQQFSKLGLKPGTADDFQLPFIVYRDSVVKTGLRVNEIDYVRGVDYGVYTDYNHACDLRFSELVFAGYGINDKKYDNYKDLNVSGKLIVVYGDEPMKDGKYIMTGTTNKGYWYYPPAKAKAARGLGAAAVLVIMKEFPVKMYDMELSSLWRTPYQFFAGVNTFFISEKVAKEIFKEKYKEIEDGIKKDTLPSFVLDDVKIKLNFSRKLLKLESSNVLGILEGTDKKDEYVLITAHYDHLGKINNNIYYGADDNGSGTSAVLKLAEAFAKAKEAGHKPRRSIVFMLVSGEENGLWGSDIYASNPIFPLDKTTVNLNMDMIGRTGGVYQKDKDSANYVFVIGDDKLSSDLRPISENNNKYTKLKLDYRYNDLNDTHYYYYRSDHYNFATRGVPIIFYTDGEHADYHKTSDTMEKINYALLARRAQLVFYTAWEMANMDRMLKRDIPLKQ